MPDLLSPLTFVVAAVLAATHRAAGALGLATGSPGAWLLALLFLVVVVRAAMLPLVVHGLRSTHARARATPQLRELQRRYAGSRDPESLRRRREEQRLIHREHGVSAWSFAPALLQLPLVYALYRVVSDLAAGHAVGVLDVGLVASASAASVLGLHLTSRLGPQLAQDLPGALVLVGLALVAAALSFATQRWATLPMTVATDPSQTSAALLAVQQWMPWLSAVGILVAAAFVPAGVLVYGVLTNAWTLVQQLLVRRFAPPPGSPAAGLQKV